MINNSDKQVGLYSGGRAYILGGGLIFRGGLIFGGGGWAYIWNEVSVSTCGVLIHGGSYIRGGGSLYSEVYGM